MGMTDQRPVTHQSWQRGVSASVCTTACAPKRVHHSWQLGVSACVHHSVCTAPPAAWQPQQGTALLHLELVEHHVPQPLVAHHVPQPHLELVEHHVPQPLVVHHVPQPHLELVEHHVSQPLVVHHVPQPHLELVRYHVPQPLVVHEANVDVAPHLLSRQPADHRLLPMLGVAVGLKQAPKALRRVACARS